MIEASRIKSLIDIGDRVLQEAMITKECFVDRELIKSITKIR